MKRILILSLKHLGDIVTTTCVLPLLKSAWPEVRIDYLVNPGGVDLVRYHSLVNNVYVAERKAGWHTLWRLGCELRRQRYDLVLDYSEGDRGAMWGLFSGASLRIGYRAGGKKYFRDWSHNLLLPNRTRTFDRHICDCHAEALTLLGQPPGEIPFPSLKCSDAAPARAQALLKDCGISSGESYCLAHFTARDAIRLWPEEYCAEAINYLSERAGTLLLVSWDDPQERTFIAGIIAKTTGRVIDLAGRADLDILIALLQEAKLFIGLDSLVGHMAAALGRPTVSIFGPASNVHWAPRGAQVRVAHVNKSCRPCVRGGCLGNSLSACLKELSFAQYVKPLIEELL